MSSLSNSMKLASTPKRTPKCDRFIPNRGTLNHDVAHFSLTNENFDPQPSPSKDAYKDSLAKTMQDKSRILTLQQRPPPPPQGFVSSLNALYSQNKVTDFSKKKTTVYIPSAPEKILDAPDMVDDYYLNLLDWSSTNLLAVALGNTVFLWNAQTGNITELMSTSSADDIVTSVSWVQEGSYIAVGTDSCEVTHPPPPSI
jgi:cell division cycle 20, cofactor of APC complex